MRERERKRHRERERDGGREIETETESLIVTELEHRTAGSNLKLVSLPSQSLFRTYFLDVLISLTFYKCWLILSSNKTKHY